MYFYCFVLCCHSHEVQSVFSVCELIFIRNSVKFCGAYLFWYCYIYLAVFFSVSSHFQYFPSIFKSKWLPLSYTDLNKSEVICFCTKFLIIYFFKLSVFLFFLIKLNTYGRASALIATICITTKSKGQEDMRKGKRHFDAGVEFCLWSVGYTG